MSTTALVVDDHAGFRTSARFLLEMEGFEVVGEAADGASAVESVEQLRPDLVLLDVQLPDAQGYDVARQIFERGLSPRIVLISSRDESDYGDNVRTSGAVGFLNKAELSGDRLRALLEKDASCS
jgi:DNA-binding NarL/FixJ family response regulator